MDAVLENVEPAASPRPFEIVSHEAGRVASNGAATLQVFEPEAKLFRRRAVKGVGTAAARPVEWAVAELDGVRCYFDGTHVVLTRRDLMP